MNSSKPQFINCFLALSLALCVLSRARASAQRIVPLTKAARQQIQSIHQSLPDHWPYLGLLHPKSAKEINYSLLGIGGEVLDRDFADFHAYKKYLDPLGAKRIRLQSGWAKTEKERGVYDFDWLDQIIDGSLERGVEPWLELSYGNLIYPDAGGTGLGEGLIKSEEGLAAWDCYVTKAARHYADRIAYYEIWNEADINHRPNAELSEEAKFAYPKLFVRTAEIIRRVDPNAFIIGLALARVGNKETVTVFMEYLAKEKKLHLLDGISIHGYPSNPDHNFEYLEWMRSYLDRFDAGIVIWQGETGAPSARQPQFALSNQDWSELSQAKWNTRRALSHIGRSIPFSQFQIADMYYQQKTRNTLNTKGLLKTNPDHSVIRPKLAYYSYQNVCSLFCDGVVPVGPAVGVESSHSNLSAFMFRHDVNGRNAYALWDNSGKPVESIERIDITLTIPEFRVKEPVYIDLVSGLVFEVPVQNIVLGGGKVVLNNFPIWDAPVVLTDRSLVRLLKTKNENGAQ